MKDLNFFSIYQGSIKERKNEYIGIYCFATVVSIIIVLVSGFYAVRLYMIGNTIQEYVNKLNANDIQSKLKEAEIVNNKLSILSEYEGSLSNVIKSVRKTDLIDDQFLIGISSSVPSDISFTEWKMNGYELSIKGISKNRIAVAELEHNLKEISEFKIVHVDKIKVGEKVGDNLTFEITCILKEVKNSDEYK